MPWPVFLAPGSECRTVASLVLGRITSPTVSRNRVRVSSKATGPCNPSNPNPLCTRFAILIHGHTAEPPHSRPQARRWHHWPAIATTRSRPLGTPAATCSPQATRTPRPWCGTSGGPRNRSCAWRAGAACCCCCTAPRRTPALTPYPTHNAVPDILCIRVELSNTELLLLDLCQVCTAWAPPALLSCNHLRPAGLARVYPPPPPP